MSNKKPYLAAFFAAILTFTLIFSAWPLSLVKAAEQQVPHESIRVQDFINLKQNDERWGRPVFAYGKDLTDEELVKTAMLFGISDWSQVRPLPISAADMLKFIDPHANPEAKMFSSVLIQRRDSGLGVQVYLMTPEMISNITAAQYAGSAITAGVRDARIVVGTVKQATGESALTGVYKAFAEKGEALNEERMQLAQEELRLVSSIAKENAGDDEFSVLSYDQAIVEIKEILADRTSELEELLKPGEMSEAEMAEKLSLPMQEISDVVSEVLSKYELSDILSAGQVDDLQAFFTKWQQTAAKDAPELKEQLQDLANRLYKYGGELVEDLKESGTLDKVKDLSIEGLKKASQWAKDGYKEAEESGFFDRAGEFIKEIIQAVFKAVKDLFAR